MYLIFKKLAQKEPKRILIVFFMMIITGFLDMASIGLLIPLLNSLFDSSMQIPFLTEFFVKLSLTMSKSEIIQLSLVLIFSTFLIKNIFILIFTKINTNFIGYLTVSFQQHVFRKYIDLPFSEIKKKNTSEYLRNIIQETRMLTGEFLAPALNLLLNLITILFFFFLLVNVNFKISFLILFFSLIIFLLFTNIFKKIIDNFGRQRQKYNLNATEYVKQTFDGFKELKISNKEDFFEGNFKRVLSKFINMGVYRSVVAVLPRAAIEVLMILVFTSIFFISLKMDNDLNKLFSVISFYVAAFFRILPNLTSMIRNYQKMNYSKSAFNLIEDLFELPDDKKNNSNIIDSKNEFIFENKIEFVDVSFAYKEKIIFENLNLKINKNSISGIQGDSGAGKSTFVDLFCGLNKPQKGQILVDSVNILNNERDWMKKIGYVQQDNFIFDNTLEKNITLENDDTKIDKKLLKECIENSSLVDLVENFSKGIDEELGEFGSKLSGGQKQRICIARALYKKPKVLIFDESFNNFEEGMVNKILDTLLNMKNKMNIILISHNKNLFKYCDKVYKIEKNKFEEIKT